MREKVNKLFLLSVVLFSALIACININSLNAAATQDYEQIEITLNCRLESDSAEILSNLMPTGTYDFFSEPEFDLGLSDHDVSRFDLTNIQWILDNSTAPKTYNLTNVDDWSNKTNLISEYLVSAPKDTVISFIQNCTYEDVNGEYVGNSGFDTAGITGNDLIPYEDDSGLWLFETTGSEVLNRRDVNYNIIDTISIPNHNADPDYRDIVLAVVIIERYAYVFYYSDNNYGLVELYLISSTDPDTWTYQEVSYYAYQSYQVSDACYFGGYFYTASGGGGLIRYNSDFSVREHILADVYLGSVHGVFHTCYVKNDQMFCLVTDHIVKDVRLMAYDTSLNRLEDNIVFTSCDNTHLGLYSWNETDPYFYSREYYHTDIYQYKSENAPFFETFDVLLFNYSVLNVNSSETFNTTLSSTSIDIENDKLNATYYIDSTMFTNYSHIADLTVKAQNITFRVKSPFTDPNFNYTMQVNYSANDFRVPTEESFTVNSVEVIDSTYNSGYIPFDTFQETLTFDADHPLFFVMNSTTLFTFSFNLDVVSKTYLEQSFKLMTDHNIIIDDIVVNSGLNIKKFYLNNIVLSHSGNTYDANSTVMNQYNIFHIEIILSGEIYLPLQYIMNDLGSGTSTMYLESYTNQISYNSISRFNSIGISIPTGHNVAHYNSTFSNLKYTPYYVSNSSKDTFGSGYTSIANLNKNTDFNRAYNLTNTNATFTANNTLIYPNRNCTPSQPSDFLMINGSSDYAGVLDSIDGSYTTFTSFVDEIGHYNGTYSFLNDALGSLPAGFSEYGTPTGGIISGIDGHSKVLKSMGNAVWEGYYQSFTGQASGTIEYYIRAPQTNSRISLRIGDGGIMGGSGNLIIMEFSSSGTIVYNDGGAHTICAYLANTWYHMKIEFDCASDWHFWLDGVSKDGGAGYGFYGNPTALNSIEFIMCNSGASAYIDALSYSWDNAIGDNLNPIPAEINATITTQITNIDKIKDLRLYYSLKTNNSQKFNVSVWNYTSNAWKLINNSKYFDFYNSYYDMDSSLWNSTNHIRFMLYGCNLTMHPFLLYLEKFNFIANLTMNITDLFTITRMDIDDSLAVVNQTLTLNWIVACRFPVILNITQKYSGITNLIYRDNLLNNSLQSFSFENSSIGFFSLNLTFIDNFSHYGIYTVNYSVISSISISASYQNPVLVQSNNTIEVNIFSDNSIDEIYYYNGTDYITEYNSAAILHEYEFNFTVRFDVITVYNLSIKAVSNYNDSFYLNISNLQFVKRSTMIDIHHLYSRYWQNQNVSVIAALRDVYNNPIIDGNITYTIEAPNGTIVLNSSKLTNSYGNISISLNLSIAFRHGFYHFNISFLENSSYLSYWKLTSFDVFPIERTVSNCSGVNMTVNGAFVGGDNFIQVNSTSTVNISSADNCTFDLVLLYKLNYSETITYEDYLTYEFQFDATSDLYEITITNATLLDYPTAFVYYLFDGVRSVAYTISGSQIFLDDLDGCVMDNLDTFTIDFRKHENDVYRTQITTIPSTITDSVQFQETLIANRTFRYWYYKNVDALSINSVSLTRLSNLETISSFTQEGLKFYFAKNLVQDERLNSLIDVDPNWNVQTTVLEHTGLYTRVRVNFSSDIEVSNVNLYVNLTARSIYNEVWNFTYQSITYNATQNTVSDCVILSGLTFNTTTQSIILEGYSAVPLATITEFQSETKWKKLVMGKTIAYGAFLSYPYYTEKIHIPVEDDWNCYHLEYGDEFIGIERISDTVVESEYGFDSNITNSFLYFDCEPIQVLDYERDYDVITITINTTLPISNAYIKTAQDIIEETHQLEIISSDIEIDELTDKEVPDLANPRGTLYFQMEYIPAGVSVIKIRVVFQTPMEALLNLILPFSLMGGLVIAYYYIKHNEKKVKEFFEKVDKRVLSKLKSKKNIDGVVVDKKEGVIKIPYEED